MATAMRATVWVTKSKSKSKAYKQVPEIVGGALCVDPSGLLLTTVISTAPATVVKLNRGDSKTVTDPEQFKVRARCHGGEFRDVTFEGAFPEFGIVLYRVVRRTPDEIFAHVDLASEISLVREDDLVYSYIHESGFGMTYSKFTGQVSYPMPPANLVFPGRDTPELLRTFSKMSEVDRNTVLDDAMHRTAEFRTVGGVIQVSSENQDFVVEALDWFVEIPLLQVSGLGMFTYAGQAGCPVFNRTGDGLLGLIAFVKGCSTFIFPVTLLRHVFRILVAEMPMRQKRKRGTTSTVGGSSGSGSGFGGFGSGKRGRGGGGGGRWRGKCGGRGFKSASHSIGFPVTGRLTTKLGGSLEDLVMKLPNISTGLVVAEMAKDSLAYCSGMQHKDVIMESNDSLVRSKLKLFDIILDKVGDSVEVTVVRASDGEQFKLSMTIGETSPDNSYKCQFGKGGQLIEEVHLLADMGQIAKDSPVYCSRMQHKDVIMEYNDSSVRSNLKLFDITLDKVGDSVEVTVVRASDGDQFKLSMTSGETSPDNSYKCQFGEGGQLIEEVHPLADMGQVDSSVVT